MKILITGANGQLGQALQSTLADFEVEAHDIDTLDLTDEAAVSAKFADYKPEVVINAAAYTAVDKAEEDSATADLINHLVVATLARNSAINNARLIHVSTDFVFDGQQATPYHPDSDCNPISVYGSTKLDGERAITTHLPNKHLIFRTAWLYSATGNNFVKTMLRLMSERNELGIVYDQVGTPTSAATLAELIKKAIQTPEANGVYHWTDAGVASWYDFAVAIYEEATHMGLLSNKVAISPIPCSAYPTPAKRPAFSVLDKSTSYQTFAMPISHWRVELRKVLSELKNQE